MTVCEIEKVCGSVMTINNVAMTYASKEFFNVETNCGNAHEIRHEYIKFVKLKEGVE